MHWTPLLALMTAMPVLAGPTLFTYMSPESEHDPRSTYDREVLRLALEKTRASHGDYRMQAAPPMTLARMWVSLRFNHYPNLFAMDSYRADRDMSGIDYVRFPIHIGIVSYRICFVSPTRKDEVAKATSLDELKRFDIGQGKGWLDVEILRRAGFKVLEVEGYEQLFKMVARGRFDLFCRGVSELRSEQLTHDEVEGLKVDDALMIYYPLPRVFYTNANNREALKRVEQGLQIAWQDGSLQALWRKSFGPAIAFAHPQQRRLIKLENPFLKGISFDYRPYFYNPLTDRFGDQ